MSDSPSFRPKRGDVESHLLNPSSVPFNSVVSDTTIGIRFDRHSAEVRGSLVSAATATESVPEILATECEALPAELLRKLTEAEHDPIALSERESLRTELTEIASRLSERLLGIATQSQFGGRGFADSILGIGIHGDGLWSHDRAMSAYHELIDPSRIAERTGKTVVSCFPDRDIAQGGVGGPMEVHGLWWLLADRDSASGNGCHWRGLVTLDSLATRFTVVGPVDQHLKTQTFPSVEVCVGLRFLSEVIAEATADGRSVPDADAEETIDSSKLVEKGRPIQELVEIWQAISSFDGTWSPTGISPLSLVYAMKNSIYAKAPVEDLLATAVHFIATQVMNYVRHNIPASRPIGELFVMGEGPLINALHASIRQQLPEISIHCATEIGRDRTLYSASVAALALLHLWQIPLPSTVPGQVPRVLGRITPGSPSNWRHVLSVLNTNAPWLLPLREAI